MIAARNPGLIGGVFRTLVSGVRDAVTALAARAAARLTAIDFLGVPTATFNVLYVFFALSLERRHLLHVNVTSHPYAAWTAQQIIDAVGFDTAIVRLIRDRDGIYGTAFDARVNNLRIRS